MQQAPEPQSRVDSGAPRADYFIHGRGRGHASRCEATLGTLNGAGYRVTLYAGGDALDLIGHEHSAVSLVHRAPLRRGATSPLALLDRSARDVRRMLAEPPGLIVADGDQAAVLAGRTLGVPTVAIGHDLVFDRRVRQPPLPRAALYSQRLNALPMRAASRWIAVHFLPVASDDPRLLVARPDSPINELPLPVDVSDSPVLCYFRDRDGLHLARQIASTGRQVVLFGDVPRREPGITVHAFSRAAFRRALFTCSAVVGSSGSNLLAECVTLGKPVLATHRRGEAEQALNARLIDSAEVGMGCELNQAHEQLPRFLHRVKSQDFARVDLARQLAPLSEVMARTLEALQ